MSLEAGANDVLHKPFGREELLARINTLRQLKASTEQAIRSEVAMLQAQINPHFLHNALNALAASCYEDTKAYEATVMLSEYFRYSFSLSPDTKVIPLSQEIELVKAYLSVEKLRFGEKLDYTIRLEDTDGVTIRPFLIQPLVENAVRDGITKKEGGGHIWVSSYREKYAYKIAVSDDGVGMAKETVARN
jgi:LytS/YehU family sensor histidine kinase